MTLKELLDKFDGNIAITVMDGKNTVFFEQGLENIREDDDYASYTDRDVSEFSVTMSKDYPDAPVLSVKLFKE